MKIGKYTIKIYDEEVSLTIDDEGRSIPKLIFRNDETEQTGTIYFEPDTNITKKQMIEVFKKIIEENKKEIRKEYWWLWKCFLFYFADTFGWHFVSI